MDTTNKTSQPSPPPRSGDQQPLPYLAGDTLQLPKLEPRRRRPTPENPIPRPLTPVLPEPPKHYPSNSFIVPTRRILSKADHDIFLSSPTYDLLLAWIFGLSESVADTLVSDIKDNNLSPQVRTLLQMLDEIEQLVYQTPPDEQGGSRFGNKRFQLFVDKIKAQAMRWHTQLGVENINAIPELSTYLSQSFGNRKRIDYGSGHELNFMVWLLGLYQLRILTRDDFAPLVLKVFLKYLEVMRLIQSTYYLEPAGSHGVWGLDDYQFLPFLFGASQLLHHKYITPRAIHQELILEQFGREYLYLNQIVFVNSTKTVKGLRWHSPMLDDISATKSWEKVEGGMRRMFVAEVLKKLPVMQHFLFGSLIPAAQGMSHQDPATPGGLQVDDDEDIEEAKLNVFEEGGIRHVHQQNGWGECCGIKVPSGVAAGMEAKKRAETLRRIPFD